MLELTAIHLAKWQLGKNAGTCSIIENNTHWNHLGCHLCLLKHLVLMQLLPQMSATSPQKLKSPSMTIQQGLRLLWSAGRHCEVISITINHKNNDLSISIRIVHPNLWPFLAQAYLLCPEGLWLSGYFHFPHHKILPCVSDYINLTVTSLLLANQPIPASNYRAMFYTLRRQLPNLAASRYE